MHHCTPPIGAGQGVVSAKDAHFLFSSMGFPLDLTQLMAAERGLLVDTGDAIYALNIWICSCIMTVSSIHKYCI